MSVCPDRLELLPSPPFIAALALLVVNDFALKPLLHNAVTGKLSDFAGLFALTLFAATLWPRHRRLAACTIAAAFTFWKTSYAEPLIEWLNLVLPFAVDRIVDLTDLVALPMIPLAVWVAPRLRPCPLPRLLQVGLAAVAPMAFTATSRIPYVARSTIDTSQAAVSEADLQAFFDEAANRQGLRCEPCTPLSEGRVYYQPTHSSRRNVDMLRVRLAGPQQLLFVAADDYEREGRRNLRALTENLQAGLAIRFPDIVLIELATGELYGYQRGFSVFVIRFERGGEFAERAERTVSSIIEDVAGEHGLSGGRGDVYYAGERVGSPARRELVLSSVFDTNASIIIRIVRRTDGFEALQATLTEELAARLDAAFGPENVTQHVLRDSWDR
jgi:hypothetical protein